MTLRLTLIRALIAALLFASAFGTAWGQPGGGGLILVSAVWCLLYVGHPIRRTP